MNPEMSVNEMLDRFIFVVKGSRLIDRKATDWGQTYWLDEKYVRHLVYSMSDMKRYFSPRRTKWRDPFNEWFKHPRRVTARTLSDAMLFADAAARGLLKPRIDMDTIEKNARVRQSAPHWVRAA